MFMVVDTHNKVQYPASQKKRGMELTSLDELYSRKETATAVGKSGITLKRWQKSENVIGLGLGARREGEYYTIVYTQRMIDAILAEEFPVEPVQDEIDSILSGDQVAKLLGKPRQYVAQHQTRKPIIPHKKIGNSAVYIRVDVMAYAAKYSRVTVENGRVGDYYFADAINKYMQAHSLSQNMFSKKLKVQRQYVGKILQGQTQTMNEAEFKRIQEVLEND